MKDSLLSISAGGYLVTCRMVCCTQGIVFHTGDGHKEVECTGVRNPNPLTRDSIRFNR